MKLGAFKEQLQIFTRGDIKLPGFDELKMLMDDVAADIHRAVTPLEKIELDTLDFEVDYHINDKYFVRKFKSIEDNDEFNIDFVDEMLINALINGIALKRCYDEKKFAKYNRAYLKALSVYEINNFDERSYEMDSALAAKGWLKPYDINYALDTRYVWDEEFINKLDFWMANIHTAKNLSYRKFVYLFIDFQNGKADSRRDLRELDRLMKARIRP
ncbi:hypothetical protein [Campylobacter sp. RM16188]|uniref:hypothetical protein n=1 Tax=Campylobacter sp. RM16188 TaxID=1705725 RepID=UPI0015539C2F|nr:hypothetical protein [Campylobacter sp. RM16188]